jgi:transcriptional regulator with XRE-family HTH domain
MSRTLRSPRHEALRRLLIEQRKAAALTQTALAKRLGRYQSFIADLERGQRRVDVVEFLELAEAIGFDPVKAIRSIAVPQTANKQRGKVPNS